MRISFLMPTYNRAGHIAESIESILCQIGPHDELLVIDDGSVDATQDVVKRYSDRLRYVRQENAGKSTALNHGLAVTSGQYVWICDDDDLLLPGAVELLHDAIEGSAFDMVVGKYSRFCIRNGEQADLGTGYWPRLETGSLARHMLEDMFAYHNASLVRRSAYERVGPFDPEMLRSQDFEMFVRLALTSSIAFVDELVFLQRVHSGDRGPAAIVHGVAKSGEVWQRFDRQIFERLRDLVPLDYFVSMYDSPDPGLARRAGLLQRACILARHGLWADALEDCVRAASAFAAQPLHELEIATCRRMTAGKHGFAGLLNADIAAGMRRLARESRMGRAILGEISRGLLWRLKSDDPDNRWMALRHLIHAPNAAALTSRMLGAGKGASASQLREREPDLRLTADALRQWCKPVASPAFSPA